MHYATVVQKVDQNRNTKFYMPEFNLVVDHLQNIRTNDLGGGKQLKEYVAQRTARTLERLNVRQTILRAAYTSAHIPRPVPQ